MANVRLLARNLADTATITAVTAESAYPASNLALAARGSEFRTTDASANRQIKLTWGTSQRVDTIALCRHNLTDAATWKIYFYSDSAWTTSITSTADIDAFTASLLGANATITDANVRGLKSSVYYHSSVLTTVKSIIIEFDDAANADGYISATRLFVGEAQTVTRNAAYDAALEWAEDSQQARTLSGTLRSVALTPPYRRLALAFNHVPDGDYKTWSDVYRYCGRRADFWLDLYPGEGTTRDLEARGQYKFERWNALVHSVPGHYSTGFTAVEA